MVLIPSDSSDASQTALTLARYTKFLVESSIVLFIITHNGR